MAGLKNEECRTKFRQRVSIHVEVRTRKKLSDADSFTTSTKKGVLEGSCVVNCNKAAITSESRDRRSLKSGKMKRCSVLDTANGVAVGEAPLPIWRDHFKTLLNREAPCVPEREHIKRAANPAVNEEPPTSRRFWTREMKKIIHSIWIDERIPDSWRHAITIPLHKKLSITDPTNYRGISLLRVICKVLERIIREQLIKHLEETKRDEQAGFRPG
ncbi:hypothetical protein RB195_022332 [Necator americanus]|uniref:Reverse transcriptase domain-containing protein n=1 Tax=Necator americanus TaxID=51031 RepID=A0ABR1EEV7_NECAM